MKWNSLFLIIFFLMIISLPFVFSDKAGGKVSVNENRTLASFPNVFTSEMKLIPGFRKGLENWITDNVGFRKLAISAHAGIDLRLFRISPSSMVFIGKDGWYFYTGNNNLDIAKGTYPASEDLMATIAENQVRVQQALRKKGIEYVVILVPSKVSIYPEYLGGNFSVRKTVIDILGNYLQEHTTIPVLSLKPDLLKAKGSEIVYLKTNTHWNYAGVYIGYSAIVQFLDDMDMIHSSPVPVSTTHSVCVSDLAEAMGDVNLLPPEPCEVVYVSSPNAIKIGNGGYFDQMQEVLKEDRVDIQNGYFSYENPGGQKKRLLIYGDSNIAYFNLAGLLAENFSHTDFIWSYEVRKNVIDLAKPDIVILQVSESMITYLGAPDSNLINEP